MTYIIKFPKKKGPNDLESVTILGPVINQFSPVAKSVPK